MSAVTAGVPSASTARSSNGAARRWALGALALGTASAIALAVVVVTMTLSDVTDDDRAYHHAGDYWANLLGVPAAAAAAILLVALRALQPHARRRLTLAGAVANAIALAVLAAEVACSAAQGADAGWGPAYPVATVATFLATALFAAGTWRTGLFPRPLLGAWPVVWLLGGFAAQGASPLVLAALYGAMAIYVVRRT
jgi:hypothetical protein